MVAREASQGWGGFFLTMNSTDEIHLNSGYQGYRSIGTYRDGRSLRAAMPNGRCKVHGGKSTGPRMRKSAP
jgi:hypothetical protein